MNKRDILGSVGVLVIGGLLFSAPSIADMIFKKEGSAARTEDINTEGLRELQSTVSYDVPDGTDTVRFSVFLDDEARVAHVVTIDIEDPAHTEKLVTFSEGLTTVIKGKKLSEIGPVDRVGTSSLTTAAFNSALAELKSQL